MVRFCFVYFSVYVSAGLDMSKGSGERKSCCSVLLSFSFFTFVCVHLLFLHCVVFCDMDSLSLPLSHSLSPCGKLQENSRSAEPPSHTSWPVTLIHHTKITKQTGTQTCPSNQNQDVKKPSSDYDIMLQSVKGLPKIFMFIQGLLVS